MALQRHGGEPDRNVAGGEPRECAQVGRCGDAAGCAGCVRCEPRVIGRRLIGRRWRDETPWASYRIAHTRFRVLASTRRGLLRHTVPAGMERKGKLTFTCGSIGASSPAYRHHHGRNGRWARRRAHAAGAGHPARRYCRAFDGRDCGAHRDSGVDALRLLRENWKKRPKTEVDF